MLVRLVVAMTISYNLVEAAVAWQFAGHDPARREAIALRVVAWSFFGIAVYIAADSVLSGVQRRAGRELGSASAVVDSKQTLLCTYLSGILSIGSVLEFLIGWSWADPLAALVIAVIEGRTGDRRRCDMATNADCPRHTIGRLDLPTSSDNR
jgi:divalent metal cation (Fe/Co/Zn/Cd) transporter